MEAKSNMRNVSLASSLEFIATNPRASELLKQIMADNEARKGKPTYLNPNICYK